VGRGLPPTGVLTGAELAAVPFGSWADEQPGLLAELDDVVAADQLDDGPVRGEAPSPPALGDVSEQGCSIVFRLDVPGGEWPMVISRRCPRANAGTSIFQARFR
jgi:hypothetical protein